MFLWKSSRGTLTSHLFRQTGFLKGWSQIPAGMYAPIRVPLKGCQSGLWKHSFPCGTVLLVNSQGCKIRPKLQNIFASYSFFFPFLSPIDILATVIWHLPPSACMEASKKQPWMGSSVRKQGSNPSPGTTSMWPGVSKSISWSLFPQL